MISIHRIFVLMLVLLCTINTVLPAVASSDALLVDAAWLRAHLDDPDLVLLHVGDRDDYAKAHLPGARFVTLDDVSVSEHTRDGLMLELPGDDALRERLETLGISDRSRIVVYYGTDRVSPATRIVLTLHYSGLGERTSLLDGGQRAWVEQGGAVTDRTTPVTRGTLSALRPQPLVVDRDYVRTHLDTPGVAIVDARAASFYDGVETGGAHGQSDRTGHIRGARSLPFTTVIDDQLRLRPIAQLRAAFDAAGIAPGDTVVAYCHIGQQATAVLFAARLLGHPVRLYDGSFQDWSRGDDHPVETLTRRTTP